MCNEMQIGGVVVKPEVMYVNCDRPVSELPKIAIKFEVISPTSLTPEMGSRLKAELRRWLRGS